MIKKQLRWLSVFFLLCFSLKVVAQTEILLNVEGVEETSLPELAKIINHRFENIKTGFFTVVKSAPKDDKIAVTFLGWMPSTDQINYLISTQGSFHVYLISEDSQLLITQQDVIDADGMETQGLPALGIRVSDEFSKGLYEKTKEAAGQQVELRWDGDVYTRMMIGGPLSAFSALTVGSVEEAELMAAVLKAGSLPAGVLLSVDQSDVD